MFKTSLLNNSTIHRLCSCCIGKMNILRIAVCFLLMKAIAGQNYSISMANATGVNSQTLCSLATPPIQFTTRGPTVDIPSDILSSPLWVGYSHAYSTFSYKGCFRFYDIEDAVLLSMSSNTIADPGLCYSYCRTKYIGLAVRSQRCYCLQDYRQGKNLDSDRCSAPCSFPEGIPCGSDFGQSEFVSVYERTPEPEAQEDRSGGYCLVFEPTVRDFLWTDCGKYFQTLCTHGNGTLTDNLEFYTSWRENTQKCFNEGLYPVDTTTNLSSVPSYVVPFWTGVIRSFSIYNSSDLQWSAVRQGYVERTGNIYNLLFFSDTGVRLHALCDGDSPPTATSTRGYTNSTTTTARTTSAQTETTQSTSHPDTSTNRRTTPADGQQSEQEGSSNNPLVAVYVAAPVVGILAIVIVAGVIFWRRRQRSRDKSTEPPYYVNTAHPEHNATGPPNSHTAIGPSNVYETNRNVTNDEHEYSGLEHGQDTANTYVNEQTNDSNVVDRSNTAYANERTNTAYVYGQINDAYANERTNTAYVYGQINDGYSNERTNVYANEPVENTDGAYEVPQAQP